MNKLFVFSPKRLVVFMLTLLVLVVGLGEVSSVSAQCVPRSDWPVYTIVRGDTLAKIARRYGTTVSTLVAGNCLTNANIIYAGQQLRVPSGGVIITPPPPAPGGTSYNLRVSFQTYERGFMIWRTDNGEISVYLGSGSGTVRNFPASSYARLPDNPIPEPAMPEPRPFVKPLYGFGKVWGNYADVRDRIGWATQPEIGYVTTITRYGGGVFSFTTPTMGTVTVDAARNWILGGSVPPPPPPPPPPTPVPGPIVTTTFAAYQPYDGGFMIWEANTSNVVAFYNNSSYTVYAVVQYGSLPDNPVPDPTPAGRIRPINGFGRVWGNFYDVRVALGWALTNEQGFTATFRTTSVPGVQTQTCFNLPDGRFATYIQTANPRVRYWSYSGAC